MIIVVPSDGQGTRDRGQGTKDMRYYPAFEEFAELARGHTVVPVYRQLVGDALTPVSAFCKIQEGEWAFLFESVVGGERLGRYSFLGSGPFLRFQAYQQRVRIEEPGGKGKVQEFDHADPLRLLEERLALYRAPHVPGLPRFCGGAVGYAGYDAVRYVERLPNPPPDDRGLPDLCFAFYDRMVIFDHINKTVAAVAHAHVDPDSLERSYQAACKRARVPSTPCARACRLAHSAARRRCGRWRSSTNWSRTAAVPTAARSATSISAATWIRASPCVPWC